ncbi:MAG TPA: DEAD/DEAH box helicase, partial [Massilibacterium sp.]|nr:DEAD/DEAH box helicase [Massilibacterium sp.]
PPSTQALEKLLATGFSIGKDLSDLMEELITQKAEILKPSTDIEIPGLGGTLYPFQAQGVNFIDARNGRALIGDEMRLGKSIQTLAWLQLRQNIRPVVLVVPAAVKYDWRNKALEWMDSPNVQVLEGQTPYPITGELVIINYHILQYWVKELIEFGPEVLVVDEIQRIKNKQAKRTKACLKLGKKTKHVIGLSGTFIKNRPEEGFNAIQLIDRSIFPNKWHYLHRYCDAKHNGFGWDFSGASNTKELHDILSNSIMLRRRLKDVKDNLPEKTKTFVPMEIDNDKEYAKAENDFINWIKGKVEKDMHTELREKLGDELFKNIKINKEQLERMKMDKAVKAESAQALVQLQALEQLAAQGKIKSVVSWISDFLESGEKLVVMAVNKFVVRQLMEAFPKIAVKIDGDLSADQKTETEQIFQTNPKIRLMIGNIQAASEGMDFSASNTVAVVQLPWSPGDLEQALKRIENINKDGVPLFHYYLLAKDTIEERKANILDKKQKVLDSVLDGKDTEDESLLTELMNQYKQG